ncbi:MAG: M23 family metallopeptidase [Armatimonadota bacterium]
MNHRTLPHALFLAVGLAVAIPAVAAPGLTPARYSYPLDGLNNWQDLTARLMSGGCWLAGLPGYPSYNGRNVHAGVDFRTKLGDLVYAIAPGVVEATSDFIHSGYGPGWTAGYAILVRSVLSDGRQIIIIYGHTQNHRVKGGNAVVAGQPLSEIGPWLAEDGGPHLHVTVRIGELPRFGWGTPTMLGQTPREGSEVVACAEDVEALGYRNPLEFLKGNLLPVSAPAQAITQPVAQKPGTFATSAETYWRQQALAQPPVPAADPFSRSAQPVRCGQGWLQTFKAQGKSLGALMQSSGKGKLYHVPEPLWTVYNLQGGAAKLGFPIGQAHDWNDAHAQGFEKALLVLEKQTDRVRVIWRKSG